MTAWFASPYKMRGTFLSEGGTMHSEGPWPSEIFSEWEGLLDHPHLGYRMQDVPDISKVVEAYSQLLRSVEPMRSLPDDADTWKDSLFSESLIDMANRYDNMIRAILEKYVVDRYTNRSVNPVHQNQYEILAKLSSLTLGPGQFTRASVGLAQVPKVTPSFFENSYVSDTSPAKAPQGGGNAPSGGGRKGGGGKGGVRSDRKRGRDTGDRSHLPTGYTLEDGQVRYASDVWKNMKPADRKVVQDYRFK
jgi:hypothetical protein